MKSILLKSMVGIALLGTAAAVNAADVPLGETSPGSTLNSGDTGVISLTQVSGSFTDDWYFVLSNTSSALSGSVASFNFGNSTVGINGLTATLYADSAPTIPIVSGLNFSDPSLMNGDYFVQLKGNTTGFSNGGYYAGTVGVVSTSSVPLPAAAWLLLSGLAGVGAMARRRKSEQLI